MTEGNKRYILIRINDVGIIQQVKIKRNRGHTPPVFTTHSVVKLFGLLNTQVRLFVTSLLGNKVRLSTNSCWVLQR